ncbi:cupin domain-containing protein [Streptomyces sp. NPDC059104]|uniref:cupin domain-containing protein n=1 Tax=Streptomyces sp. NPDC059104 TaxID=3346729 RepID=UPI00367ABBE2
MDMAADGKRSAGTATETDPTTATAVAVVVRAEDAEYVPLPHGGGFTLLTDGAPLGANRLALGPGAAGARPHFHARSAELFHVLAGTVEFRLDGAVETVGAGGTVLVPPGLPHAFGATADGPAELLAVLGPAVERFEYFRALGRIRHGLQSFDDLLPQQERYDVHFVDRA